jgi:hypothetical protein
VACGRSAGRCDTTRTLPTVAAPATPAAAWMDRGRVVEDQPARAAAKITGMSTTLIREPSLAETS